MINLVCYTYIAFCMDKNSRNTPNSTKCLSGKFKHQVMISA